MSTQHTPGPWRWQLNELHKSLSLVGGKPMYDLTIINPTRWGMGSATLMIRDTAHDGMNILHKLHERRDWIAPFPGRAHHADWCADVAHPDMRLIAAAPDLLEALRDLALNVNEAMRTGGWVPTPLQASFWESMVNANDGIAKATGGAA